MKKKKIGIQETQRGEEPSERKVSTVPIWNVDINKPWKETRYDVVVIQRDISINITAGDETRSLVPEKPAVTQQVFHFAHFLFYFEKR